MSFAVIDFETTGILPSYHHRVIEVGVVHVDGDGQITGRWETLINPERDLGAQHVHGIRAAQVLSAPVFSDIAPDLAEMLRGRAVVAHNAAFDVRFLVAEFQRAGYWITDALPHICTMRLGAQFGIGGSASLAQACDCFGIGHPHAHTAGGDAYATAELLGAYLHSTQHVPAWREYWDSYTAVARDFAYPSGRPTGVAWQSRDEIDAEPAPHFLERISTDALREGATGADAEYLALLDRCLLDRILSVSEAAQLASAAEELGLTRDRADALHLEYYGALQRAAWADGVLTDEEHDDLVAVAELLRIPSSQEVVPDASSEMPDVSEPETGFVRFELLPGDMIVLTGEMERVRSEWEDDLRARGFIPHGAITKKIKLLVAADPDSLSGKAKKARDYGIPIVNEAGLRGLISALETA